MIIVLKQQSGLLSNKGCFALLQPNVCLHEQAYKFDVNNMHKQDHVVVLVVIGIVFPHPMGLTVFEPVVPSGAFGEMWTLYLEWNGARFHAQALTTEAVGNP
jgi:hypothetical protein